jgi:hypothetical protein
VNVSKGEGILYNTIFLTVSGAVLTATESTGVSEEFFPEPLQLANEISAASNEMFLMVFIILKENFRAAEF